MSTTARYPIKPKTLTLLELCQSIVDLRQTTSTSNLYQSTQNTAQILTRRLYLHPLTINSNGKQPLAKLATNTVMLPDIEQRHHSYSDKRRDVKHSKAKSSTQGLAVLSSSLPLTARSNPARPSRDRERERERERDKISVHTDDDTRSEGDANIISGSWNQSSSLPSIARGTLSSTHATCTRPSYTINHKKTYWKPSRSERTALWPSLERRLPRPVPISPPSTPLDRSIASFDQSTTTLEPITVPLESLTASLDGDTNFNIENEEPEEQYFNYSSIQKIQIYKRNARHKSFINDDIDYDDYIYNLK